MIKKLFKEGLTKDQLFDIMTELPEETLADLQWAAEVELMDRAFRSVDTEAMSGVLRTSVSENP
jgi:hypothetical protein